MLPVVIMLLVFARLGVYPFGGRTLLVVDMDNEYIDYFVQMNKIVREQGSFLRSWDMGMGLNMLGLIAFYTASPLNIILLLCPVNFITEGVLLVTLVKFGLCGLLFSYYASYTFGQRGVVNLMFSISWALIGYNLAYSSNIMWLDGVAFLPLVLLGVEKLLREDKLLLFQLSLVYVFIASYYIGYMVGVFSFLYFVARYFTDRLELRVFVRKLLRFALSAVVAAGCCAVLLLPAYLNLRSGQEQMFEVPWSFAPQTPAVDMAAKLLPGVYDSLTDSGMPNIYTGVAGALLFLLFLLNRKVRLREKVLVGGLAAFLILSFSVEFLYLGWHAFEDPTWFPARFSFLFSFVLLYGGLRCAVHFDGLRRGGVLAAVLMLVVLFAEVEANRFRFVDRASVLLGLFLVLAYGFVVFALLRAERGRPRTVLLLLALVLLCTELHYNAGGVIAGVDEQFGYRAREDYYAHRERYLPAVERIEADYPGVCRIETLEQRNANGGMALGYNGISHYSTTTDQQLNQLLKRLGNNTGLINELRFAPTTPLAAGLLGVRYVVAEGGMGAGWELIDSLETGVSVYENMAAFPLAYWADHAAINVNGEQRDPFELQNDIAAALGVEELYKPLEIAGEHLQNVDQFVNDDGSITYTRRAPMEEGVITFELYNPDGGEGYALLPVKGGRYARAELFVDGVPMGRDLAYRHNTVIALGDAAQVELRIELQSDYAYIRDRYFYALDITGAQELAAMTENRAMAFTRFDDTAVGGSIDAPRDGLLVTSFPYDEGWTVRVDGKRVELQQYLGAFLAVEVPAGPHEIQMRYWPPGFLAGLVITLISACGLVLWWMRRRRGARQGQR